MSNIRCAAWRVTLSNGETFLRDYDVPQPAEIALACLPGVVGAEPVGEVITPPPRRRRTPRAAAATAEATRPASSRITAAEIPAEPVGELRGAGIPASPVTTLTRRPRPAALETPRWCWPPLLTEITRMHFEGRRR